MGCVCFCWLGIIGLRPAILNQHEFYGLEWQSLDEAVTRTRSGNTRLARTSWACLRVLLGLWSGFVGPTRLAPLPCRVNQVKHQCEGHNTSMFDWNQPFHLSSPGRDQYSCVSLLSSPLYPCISHNVANSLSLHQPDERKGQENIPPPLHRKTRSSILIVEILSFWHHITSVTSSLFIMWALLMYDSSCVTCLLVPFILLRKWQR